MPLARQIRECPPKLALRADVKKPETGSGFWNCWRDTELNPRSSMRFFSKALFLRAPTSIKRSFCIVKTLSWIGVTLR